MDTALNDTLPSIVSSSNALSEQEYYLDHHWIELFEKVGQTEVQLHVFQNGGRLLISTDGRIENASWNLLDKSEKFIISSGARGGELYTLAFLDDNFFILKRHGDPRAHTKLYRFFIKENLGLKLDRDWRLALQKLESDYRNSNSTFLLIAFFIILIILAFIVFSYGGPAAPR